MTQNHPPYGASGASASEAFEFSAEAKQVRRYLELAFIEHGHSLPLTRLADDLGLSRGAVRAALWQLQQGVQVMFVPGTEDVVKVPPFSNVPTRHAVSVDGEPGWYAGCAGESCAIDALFPGSEVVITSSCPDCWQPITLVVRDRHLVSVDPASTVVHWGIHPRDLSRNWVESCDRINFFVNPTHAARWEHQVTGQPGVVASVPLTFESVASIARVRHWDYDRGPEVFPPGGAPILDALASAGVDLSPWESSGSEATGPSGG